MHLNLFRVDVLAGAEDDDFLLAAGDVKAAAAVQVAEVAGVQPAVAEHGGVDVRAVEVPLHDDGAANGHFAVAGLVFGCAFRRQDFDFSARKCRTHRGAVLATGPGDGARAGAFSESVGLQNVQSQGVEVAADGGVEARPARHQQAHPAAKGVMDAPEQKRAQVEPRQVAQCAVAPEQGAESEAAQPAGSGHFLQDALVDEVEELGHADKGGDAALLECGQQRGGVHLFEEDHAGADRKRQQQIGHLGQGVEEWQDAQDGVALVQLDGFEDGLGLGQQVAVGENHSLGIAGGAGGVEDHGRVLLRGRAGGQGSQRIG